MPGKILYGVDFSPFSEKILQCADEFARLEMHEHILLHVNEAHSFPEQAGQGRTNVHDAQEGLQLLKRLSESLERRGLRTKVIQRYGDPARVIADTARQEDVAMVLVGSHAYGFMGHLTGGVADQLVKLLDRPALIEKCLIVKQGDAYSCETLCDSLFDNVLIASNFSRHNSRIQPLVMTLAARLCPPMTLLDVREERWATGKKLGRDKLRDIEEELAGLRDAGHSLTDYCNSIRIDSIEEEPVKGILSYADEMDATLIVLGSFAAADAVAEAVLRHASRPVMVLKEPEEQETDLEMQA